MFREATSTRHRSDCGMHPRWPYLRSRIEYRIARPCVDSDRGGPGCIVLGGTHQTLGRHLESLPADCEFDQMREVLFVRKADDLALATGHFAQSSSTSHVTAAQAGFFILSQSRERPHR